jgi:6-phosphogluconolactonase
MPELHIAQDEQELAERAAEHIRTAVEETLAKSRRFTLLMTGGSTPKLLYERLARPPYSLGLPWAWIHLFWGDERFVPSGHPESNFLLAQDALLGKVPLPPANIHPVPTDAKTPEEAAAHYEKEMADFFQGPPKFDLVLLGLGEDGHVASLFPGSPLLEEETRLVAAVRDAPKPPPERVTVTFPVINSASRVVFLISGSRKKPIVQSVLREPIGKYPAQLIWPLAGTVTWWLDRAAYID